MPHPSSVESERSTWLPTEAPQRPTWASVLKMRQLEEALERLEADVATAEEETLEAEAGAVISSADVISSDDETAGSSQQSVCVRPPGM